MQSFKKLIKAPEFLTLAFIALFRVVYFFCLDFHYTPDSYEYIARDGFSWLLGGIDRYRLPVYPMVIDICKLVSGSHFALLLCLLQLVVSVFSVVVLYWTLKKIIDKKWICLAITFLYGTLSAVAGWDKTLLTESFSLSLTVFIIFGIVSFLKEDKYKYVIITTLCLLVGCFLRAVFVIYLGLFFGFMLLCIIFPKKTDEGSNPTKQRKKAVKHTLIAAIPLLFVFIYAFTFNNLYGGFTLSDSALGQQLHIVLQRGYYKDASDAEIKKDADEILNSTANSLLEKNLNSLLSEFYKNSDEHEITKIKEQMLSAYDGKLDKELESDLNNYIYEIYKNDFDCSFTNPTYLARIYILENYDRDRVVQFVNQSKMSNLKNYLVKIPFNILGSYSSANTVKSSSLPALLSNISNNSLFFVTLTVLHSFVISVIELLSFIVILIKKKKADWLKLGLGTFILATILLSIIGTNGEFARTAITALPFTFVALATYANGLCSRIIDKLHKSPIQSEI